MANRKTAEERLQELNKKLEQLNNQKKQLLAKQKQEERKARTRRLIQIGALSEKYFDCANIEPEDFEKLLKEIIVIGGVQELLLVRKINSVEETEIDSVEEMEATME